MMQIVYQWFLKIIQTCETWYYHFIISEAEINEWCEEQERKRAEEDAEEARCLADYIRQQEQDIADKLAEEEEYARQREEDLKFEQEFEELEELRRQRLKEQEENEYRCPLCGTPWSLFGRCKPCDRAFGRD